MIRNYTEGAPDKVSSSVRWAETNLDVQDRRAVDRFEVLDMEGCPVHREHPHRVKPDRVGTVLRARREHATRLALRIVARADMKRVAVREVQPSEDDELYTRSEAIETCHELTIEHQLRIRGALVALAGGDSGIPQR